MNSNKIISTLKIKMNVIKRLAKEHNYYIKEKEKSQEHIEIMKINERDPYDIKKQEEIFGENHNMVIDSRNRLKVAKNDLEKFLQEDMTDIPTILLIEARDLIY